MKENRVSLYDVEVIYDLYRGGPKPVTVALHNLEVIRDEPYLDIEKFLTVSMYALEVIHTYDNTEIEIIEALPSYYFTGQVLDDVGPIEREVISYNRTTYNHMDTSFSDSEGSFFLDSTTSGICFLVALDDDGGTDYNHLVAAIVKPAVFDDYGFSELNPGKSALDIKNYNKAATFDGLYWVQPTGYTSPVQVYCDMTTQGGGWTMCARWDRDFPTDWIPCLPVNAMRSNINIEDLIFTNIEGTNTSATLNIRPIITDGANTFMHTSLDIDDVTWKYLYFSSIYKCILDNPENIFDVSFDTNDAETTVGTVVGSNGDLRNRWYDYNMNYLSTIDLEGNTYNYFLDGGEGEAMFTAGSRPGATYCSHNSSTCEGHGSPYVNWGFYGKDGTVMDFGVTYKTRVGTSSSTDPEHVSCRFNFMFIR